MPKNVSIIAVGGKSLKQTYYSLALLLAAATRNQACVRRP